MALTLLDPQGSLMMIKSHWSLRREQMRSNEECVFLQMKLKYPPHILAACMSRSTKQMDMLFTLEVIGLLAVTDVMGRCQFQFKLSMNIQGYMTPLHRRSCATDLAIFLLKDKRTPYTFRFNISRSCKDTNIHHDYIKE